MKKLEEYGTWWLPGQDESKAVTGTLTHSIDDGCELRLNGVLSDKFGGESYPRVFGRTIGGAAITLCDAFDIETTAGFGTALHQSNIFANAGYRGAHVDRDPIVSKVWVSFNSLEAVLGYRQFNWEPKTDSKGNRADLFQSLPRTSIECSDGEYQYRFSADAVAGLKWSSVKLRTEAGVLITAPSGRPLSQFKNEALRVVETIVETSFDGPSLIRRLTLIDGDVHVDVLMKPRWKKPPSEDHPGMLLFTFANEPEKTTAAIRRCRESLERTGPAHTILYSLRRTPGLPLEQRFLFLVQGLETLHRRSNPSNDRTFVKKVIELVKSVLSKEQFDWLKKKLAFAHEPTLNQRLLEVVQASPANVQELLGDVDDFARRVARTRNYLTHYDEDSKRGAYTSSRELRIGVLRTELLLKVLLAAELGYAPKDLDHGWGYRVVGSLKAALKAE
jgi:hypothetical protein